MWLSVTQPLKVYFYYVFKLISICGTEHPGLLGYKDNFCVDEDNIVTKENNL